MTVIKRGSKYGVRVYDPAAPNNQRWIGTFDNERAAKRAERDAELVSAPSSVRARTVEEWATIWLRDYNQDKAPSTKRTYRYAATRVIDEIGSMRLDRIDRPTARGFTREWPRSVSAVVRTMFAAAARDGVIPFNPFSDLRLETPKGRKNITALTEAEIASLADAAEGELRAYGPEFRALIVFLGYVGCRPGEVCCIRRADLDVDKGEVAIRYSLDGQGGEKAPKNGLARTVSVPRPALEAALTVPHRLDSPYLFHTARGKRLSKGTLSYYFRLVRAAWTGRDEVQMYELRHAAATLLVERGVPSHAVAHQLGHTDGGRLVQTLYGHPEETRSREMIRMAFSDSGADESQATPEHGSNRGVA